MDNMGEENFYQIKSYVILKNLSLQCRISPVRGLIAPINGSVIKYKTLFHWKPQKWKQCSIIKEVFKSSEVDKNFFLQESAFQTWPLSTPLLQNYCSHMQNICLIITVFFPCVQQSGEG